MSLHRAVHLGLVAIAIVATADASHAQARPVDRTKLDRMLPRTAKVVITDGRSATPVPGESATVRLAPNEMLAARVTETIRRDKRHLVLPAPTRNNVVADSAIVLPIRLVKFAPDGSPKWVLRPLVLIENGGLRYHPASRAFRGSFLLGVEDSVETQVKPLANPVSFAITANPGEVDPSQPAMAQLNADFKRVTITAVDPGDSVSLAVRPSFLREIVEFKVPVRRSRAELTVTSPSIRGFGLQTTGIMIDVPPVEGIEGTRVALVTDRGTLDPNPIVLDAKGHGSATLRSEGVGTANIRVSGAGFDSAPLGIAFGFPIVFLVAAILGGLVGTYVHNRRPPRRKRKFGADEALTAALVGIIAAVGYAVGVKLVDIDISVPFGSEATVFIIAVLVAIAWPTLIGFLGKGQRIAPSS